MRDIDLTRLMRGLNESLDYFVQVDPDGIMDFEKDYHDVAIDPDGNIRELLKEREHNLNSINEITTFMDGLHPGRILDIGCGPGWLLS